MKHLAKGILLSALLILAAGCSSFIQNPQVSLKETVIRGLDRNGVDIECRLSISNPNSFDLTLLGYRYNLQLISLPLISGTSADMLAIPAGKETLMRLPVRLSFRDFIDSINRQPDLKQVPYRFDAELLLGTPLGKIAIPVEKTGSLPVPEKYRPGYYLKQLRNLFNPPAD